MPHEAPTSSPEKKEVLDDNARKFVTKGLTSEFLENNRASSFTLITDWLETGEDNEKKLAYKKFNNGDTQILLITKVTENGNRTAEKEKITQEQYEELLASSILRVEKKRYEFNYIQGDTSFSVKYDEFAESSLRVLEVDATDENQRDFFSPIDFPSELTEVTGDISYYGYRVASIL